MTCASAHCSINALFYSAASTIIRYIFVRTSLQPDIQEVLKRDAFVYKSIVTVESLGFFNLLTFFLIQWGKRGQEKSEVLLYQSCLDPWNSSFSTPFFKVMSFNQLLVFIAAFCIIGFNLVLFTHLDNQTKNNTAISVTDQVLLAFGGVNQTCYFPFRSKQDEEILYRPRLECILSFSLQCLVRFMLPSTAGQLILVNIFKHTRQEL